MTYGAGAFGPREPLRILLIEDDSDDATFARKAARSLNRFDCEVTWVATYAEALPAMRAGGYDLVLLDHRLGHRTGLDLLAESDAMEASMPVVLLTGMADPELDRRAAQAGVSGLLEKDQLDAVRLERSIVYALERMRAERELRRTRAFFHAAFDAIADHVAIVDASGTILEVNRAWARFAADNDGSSTGCVAGANYLAVCDAAPDPESSAAAAGIREVLAGERESFEMEYPCHGPEEQRWFLMRVRSFDDAGKACVLVAHENVTARHAAEQALRESNEQMRQSEQRYRLLFEHNPLPMWVVDAGTFAIVAANDAATLHYGFSHEEFLARTAYDIRAPEDRTRLDGLRRVGIGKRFVTTARHAKKNGDLIDVEVVGHRTEFGGMDAILVVAYDVTARLDAERERERLVSSLEFERNRLALSFQHALAFIVLLRGPDHVFELANDAYYDLMGKRDLIGRPAREALPELQGLGLEEMLDRVLLTGETITAKRVPLSVRRGPKGELEQRFVDFVYQPFEEADGTRSGVLSHGVDVTDQVLAEQAIRASEERYRALVELSPDGIVIHDGAVIQFANSAAARFAGASDPEQLVGRPVMKAIHPEWRDVAAHRLRELANGGATSPMQQRWIGNDGTPRDVEVSSVPFTLGGKPMIQTVFRDVTERHQLEEQLRQSQKMEAIGRLAGGVAHDFNNLLTVIRANTEFLLEDLDGADPRRRDAIEIRTSCDRAGGLTRQLLAFSRKQILEPRPTNLRAVVDGIHTMLTRMIGEDITLEAAHGEPAGEIMADPGQVEQVLMNLVLNARDAMPDGGRILIETTDTVLNEQYSTADRSVTLPGAYVMLSVSDTGTGMPPEVQARIFEPFFTTKPVGQGTGLGLATVYGIVKQSGGHIWVYSEPGKGTTFKMYFPRIGDRRLEETRTPVTRPPARGEETVLLVEDEESVREVGLRILARHGYHVITARNGREALELAMQHPGPIHIVLTDVVMPEMSGGALVERLNAVRPEARVIYMSGYTDNDIVRRGILQPDVSFLQKPFRAERLLEMIRTTLDAS